jgi:chromate transport protein ChrA
MNARGALGGDRRRLVLVGAACIAVLAYGWWFTDLEPFSPKAFRALLVPVVVVIVVASVYRVRHKSDAREAATRAMPGFRVAVVVWSVLIAALVAWELIALRSLPRADHPTISSLVEGSEHHHLARLALYAAWVALGWTLAS